MEQFIYIPIGLMILFIGGLIAINKEIVRRPTYKETEEKFRQKEMCEKIHEAVNEKLDCIPEIKETVIEIRTKIDILLKNNNRHL